MIPRSIQVAALVGGLLLAAAPAYAAAPTAEWTPTQIQPTQNPLV